MTKLTKLAVALKYDRRQEEAPIVIASGKGELAKKILAVAEEERVPVHTDEALAGLLSSLEVGTEIPAELYEAVAQVIAFVWQLDQKYGKGSK